MRLTIAQIAISLVAIVLITNGQAAGYRNLSSFDVSPDGKQVVFDSNESKLYLANLQTKDVVNLALPKGAAGTPAFSPDCREVVFTFCPNSSNRWDIRRYTIADKTLTKITEAPGCCDASPEFSSDGKQIVFARAHRLRPYSMGGKVWDDWAIYASNRDGSDLRRLLFRPQDDLSRPSFGANSESIVFASEMERDDRDRFSVVSQMSLHGTKAITLLTPDESNSGECAAAGSDPSVSRNGEMLAFISDRAEDFEYDIYAGSLTTAPFKASRLTTNGGYKVCPRIALECGYVFFLSEKDVGLFSRACELWKVRLDGTGLTKVADSTLFDAPLTWQKDPKSAAFPGQPALQKSLKVLSRPVEMLQGTQQKMRLPPPPVGTAKVQ